MRLRSYIVLCVLAVMSAGAQESAAGQSAYDILGVSPAIEPTATVAQVTTTDNVPADAPAQPAPVDETAPADQTAPADVEVSGDKPAAPAPEAADAALAEPAPDAVAEGSASASDNEAALMAEIMRLLAERDTLYQAINDLQEENNSLKSQLADFDYYQSRSAELESEIARLEGMIQEKDAALAAADARLAEVDSKPANEGAPTEEQLAAVTAERDAALAVRDAAVASRIEAEAALAAAQASGSVVKTAPTAGYLSGWALDTSRFTKQLRSGFDGSASRIGSWKIAGATASQTDAAQYFSRLELPLAQTKVATLYHFKARSTGPGWIGLGLHLFVEDVRKKHGYGEGKSLLVWFTRDRAARGDDATYLQLYRSDNDVVMERMFDAELADGIDSWRSVDILYDPAAEYIAVSVDGVLRIVYKTFFGRDSGATVSLRTLGGGGSFSDFAAWTE